MHDHHGHSHGHSHHHHHGEGNLQLAFWLNLLFSIVEFIGGWFTNSLAIMSDALHDFGDALAIGMAWRLERHAKKAADRKFSYGYRRFSLLGAFINAVILIVGSVIILSQALPRLWSPEPVHAEGMFGLALLGVAVNGFAAWRLRNDKTQNARVLAWHLYEDLLGWVAVLVASIVMLIKPMPILDPLLSVLITLWILYNVLRHFKQTANLFLQGVPDSVSLDDIETELKKIAGVVDCHHTHLWSLDGEHHVLTTHLVVGEQTDKQERQQIKKAVRALMPHWQITHSTIEFEWASDDCSMADREQGKC